ncbi:cyclin [Colletotrichum scovillei]|uniref:Cyclin n=1 Tax=Colletotrichum scovillei TaxID=1209932 RepID=A0A9P7RJY1_9PEZI|nr:cyclin [Colletotrichum scovillei]KAF4777904.1 cyclin [Colletotrichum scovillei]KAG7059509.1 cyclin [Colletotrichum scovillei]KAG7078117.1 cyclin [Colletotrichum scovillei]KAG7085232.1 cyclin [Colletotrichum scovillei]
MAAVIGDYVSDPSRFHNMIANPGIQHQHSHDSHYRSSSRSRDVPAHHAPASPRYQHSTSTPSTRQKRPEQDSVEKPAPPSAGASRFPSPPSSSSPTGARPQHADSPAYMATDSRDAGHAGSVAASEQAHAAPSQEPQQQQPSPASDGNGVAGATNSYPLSDTSSPVQQPQGQTIHIRDLAHIQSLAKADLLSGNGPGILNDPPLQAMKYEISAMPIGDIIEMVAALLTKITTTNDLQHDAMQRNVAHQQQASQNNESGNGSQMSPLSTSVLAFHGKNIPAITILSYLSRIHKYCPTTYEVFLSLLVYFDRMTERVNEMVVKHEEARRVSTSQSTPKAQSADVEMRDEDDETDSDLADDDDADEQNTKASESTGSIVPQPTPPGAPPATYFVVDSFNIHRLVIAGVTCASKFFSDVFYTNSRYAKVGGLPLAELNHLELQFLLLNDFRLAVPVEDLEAYATMLVEFYAREVVAQRSRPAAVTGGDS